MTNSDILNTECMLRNIKEEVHTYAKWLSLGYKVKRGEKALFDTKLWKYSKKKPKDAEAETTEDEINGHCYLTKAFLFGKSQVEKVEEE